jgi:hypothetical protein
LLKNIWAEKAAHSYNHCYIDQFQNVENSPKNILAIFLSNIYCFKEQENTTTEVYIQKISLTYFIAT